MKERRLTRAFVTGGGVLLILFLFAGGYSFFDFYQTITESQQVLAANARRSELIDTMQSAFAGMIQSAKLAGEHPSSQDVIREEFDRQHGIFRSARSEYLALVEKLRDSSDRNVTAKAQQYFSELDRHVERMAGAFASSAGASSKGRPKAAAGGRTEEAAVPYLESSNFIALWHAERNHTAGQEMFESHFVEKHAVRWLISTLTFLSLIGLLSLVLHRREKKISSELRRFRALFENSSNPVLVSDDEGFARYANPAFAAWSGLDDASIAGRNLFECMRMTDAQNRPEDVWALAKPVLISGKEWTGEVKLQRSDGRTVVSELIISPVVDSRGRFSECMALHSDLTERKEFTRKILETQRQYRNIVESSLDGIAVVQGGQLVYLNPSAVNIFGYASPEEMKMINFSEAIAPHYRHTLFGEYGSRAIGEEIFRSYEMRGITKRGNVIDIEANAHIIEWNDRPALQVSFRDITERKILEREQALWLWEQDTLSEIDRKIVGMVDLGKLFAAILQQTLNLTHANFGGVLLLNDARTHVRWKAVQGSAIPHPGDYFAISEPLQSVCKKGETSILHDTETGGPKRMATVPVIGEENLVSTAWFPLVVDGKCKGMLVVGFKSHHDFAGREMRLLTSLAEKHSIAMINAQLYNDLLQREKELEILSDARVQAQEEERRRIAREIHDGLGQMLTAIKFNLEIFEDTISAGEEERKRIDDMKGLLDSVMKEARELSYNLMPSVLDDFGLAPALQLLSEQFANRTGVKVMFQSFGLTGRLDPHIEIGLYRIAQESLNNVAKHAEATEINLQVIRHPNGVRLVVEDNGKGILHHPDIDHPTTRSGMGLVSMRERAASFGGTITIDSSPGRGTLITVDIPLTEIIAHE
jgi:PAS domain S-box-containing protein